MNFRCLHDQIWGEVKKMQDEIIGMLGFDVQFSEDMRRKICQVAGHNDAGAGADRSRQHMTIIRVWERKSGNEVLVSSHQRVRCSLIHELSSTLQFCAGEVRSVYQEIPDPFLVHVHGPLGAEYPMSARPMRRLRNSAG